MARWKKFGGLFTQRNKKRLDKEIEERNANIDENWRRIKEGEED